MKALKIDIGQRFGRLVVKHIETRNSRRKIVVQCDCGRTRIVDPWSIFHGVTTSCGCYNREKVTTHGMSKTKIFQRWCSMINRCTYRTDRHYKYYGGRGIKVCDRWLNSFSDFIADVGLPPDDKLQLDRINNDGNYEPGNVRWANLEEQRRNRRRNIKKRKDSKNRYRGIIRKARGRWGAAIKIDGNRLWLGSFPSDVEAARAYDAIASQYGFPLNFPTQGP